MPIVSGVAFGMTLPYTRIQRSTRQFSPGVPTRPGRISSIYDFAERAAYKYNRSSRLVNQYKLYNRRVDTPTIGTIISLEF